MSYQINFLLPKSGRFGLHLTIFISFLLLLSACGGGGGSDEPAASGSNISGVIQKGAFQAGAEITAQELADDATAGDHRATAEISNDHGAYRLKTDWSGWTEISIEGKYFDEYAASVAESPISLSGIQKITEGDVVVNVNLFSHFVAERIKYRVQNTRDELTVAKSGAERELQVALKLAAINSEQLDLQDGENAHSQANAVLLLFSGSFMATGGDSALLNTLVEDFKIDGRFNVSNLQGIIDQSNSEGIMERLIDNLKNSGVVNPPDIRDLGEPPDWTFAKNTPPQADSASFSGNEDTVQAIALSASDADGNPLTYTLVDQPQHGVVDLINGVASYSPAENYNGADSFTFTANDGEDDSAVATISLTVNAVNDKPVAEDFNITVPDDASNIEIALKGVDADGDELTYSIISQAGHTSTDVYVEDGKAIYSAVANFNGSDSFTYKVNDGRDDSNVASVNITVSSVNDPPRITRTHTGQTQEDRAIDITLLAEDNEGATLNYSIVNQPVHGSVSLNVSNGIAIARYTPDTNYFGNDSFRFKANDGTFDSNTASVAISINAVNDAPVARNGRAVTDKNTRKSIILVASDVDDTVLSYQVVNQAVHGSVSISGGTATYTPANNFIGSDSFTFKAKDGSLFSNVATVTVTVNKGNEAPVITFNHTGQTQEDEATNITLVAEDADNDALTYQIVRQATHGGVSLSISNGITRARYTPNVNYHGSDSFSFKANDGKLDSNTASVAITVNSVNDAPVAEPGRLDTNKNTSKSLVLTASDVDGTILTYEIIEEPSQGNITLNGNMATYVPNANYVGNDRFTFRANDGELNSNIVVVSIVVINPDLTIRILPLGDSITQTRQDYESYRYPLWKKLIDSGTNFDFIGSETQTYGGTRSWSDYNGHSFDQDHEGHSGWRAEQINSSLNGWLSGYTPDIVLIHLGTNDILDEQSTSSTVTDLMNVIAKLRADNANVSILLAKIIPSSWNTRGGSNIPANPGVIALNNELDGLANALSTSASLVAIVDMYDGFSITNNTYDGTHPNSSGEGVLAQRWFDAMINNGLLP